MAALCISSQCANTLATSPSIAQVFTSSLNFLFAAQCLLIEPMPEDSSPRITDPTFDFIVVGAGSAGSVVANRLSEIPCWRVLLIEAGDDPPIDVAVPSAANDLHTTAIDWQYVTEYDPRTCRSMRDGRCPWPRGKVLGGSSAINGMLYIRASPENYDNIASLGNVGWNYDQVLKYFKKSEKLNDTSIENDAVLRKYHGYDGLMDVVLFNANHPSGDDLIRAYGEIGSPLVKDVNGPSQIGTVKSHGTLHLGKREDAARAFLAPIRKRQNLFVLKNTIVTKVIFEGNVAIGVSIMNKNGAQVDVFATKEVIISGGTINTPQLLMLSGVGPKKHLEEMNIDLVADLPVGENVIDHPNSIVTVTFNRGAPPVSQEQAALNVAQYLSNQTGVHSTLGLLDIITFINTKNRPSLTPNVDFHHLYFDTQSTSLVRYCSVARFNNRVSDSLIELNKNSQLLLIFTTLIDVKSRGKILLKNKNPTTHPRIYPNTFTNKEDLETILDGVQYATTLMNTKSMQNLGAEVARLDIPECDKFPFKSRDYFRCTTFNIGNSMYHLMGSSKMGPHSDLEAVVDPALKVYKTKNLRVIDASVIPISITGNSNAATVMFAEKGADLVKETHRNSLCKDNKADYDY